MSIQMIVPTGFGGRDGQEVLREMAEKAERERLAKLRKEQEAKAAAERQAAELRRAASRAKDLESRFAIPAFKPEKANPCNEGIYIPAITGAYTGVLEFFMKNPTDEIIRIDKNKYELSPNKNPSILTTLGGIFGTGIAAYSLFKKYRN